MEYQKYFQNIKVLKLNNFKNIYYYNFCKNIFLKKMEEKDERFKKYF